MGDANTNSDTGEALTARVEQYKAYAAEVYSFEDRAQVTSRLYVTLNTGVISAVLLSTHGNSGLRLPAPVLLALIACALGFCFIWWLTLRSITRHTTAKHQVLQDMEATLPLQPYTIEWFDKLESGRGYVRTTRLHEFFPLLFIVAWLVLAYSMLSTPNTL